MPGARRLFPRAGYRRLDEVLLDHAWDHGGPALARPTARIRRGVSAHAGAGLLPSRLVEPAAGRSRRRRETVRGAGRSDGSGEGAAGAVVRVTLDSRDRREPGWRA